ncbi:hypothetical protein ABMA27_005324 [Loxostege sticticalis]|uniref:Mos1 transposase HTH domain-containing protein n=1 Tax=Loxostege sticticalis TaxID=481309 RepID=A0ABR3HIR3_LOXSC
MELTRENSRAMIYYDFRSGLTQKQCVDRMLSAFGDKAPSKTTIYRWFAEFQRGRVKLSDDPRQGRPKTAVTQENVDVVRKLIEEDRHVTYREIQATLDISMSQIQIVPQIRYRIRSVKSKKRLALLGTSELSKDSTQDPQMLYTTSYQVTNPGYMRTNPKQKTSHEFGCSKMS